MKRVAWYMALAFGVYNGLRWLIHDIGGMIR
jgi:hypothetical protein